MAPKWLQLLFWAIFDKKKNSRFSLFYRGCELFSTAHFVLASTPTWLFIVAILVASYSILWLFSAIECTWELPTALGKPSRRYLKRYLKYFFDDFSQFFSKFLQLQKKDYLLGNLLY